MSRDVAVRSLRSNMQTIVDLGCDAEPYYICKSIPQCEIHILSSSEMHICTSVLLCTFEMIFYGHLELYVVYGICCGKTCSSQMTLLEKA